MYLNCCNYNNIMYKVTLGHRQLEYPTMRPELVRAVRRWGYEPLGSSLIRTRLEREEKSARAEGVVYAAGIALVEDKGRSLWPTRAFADALIGFASERRIPCTVELSREKRIAMALSVPGKFTDAISEAALSDHFTIQPGDEDRRKRLTFVGSYLHAPSVACTDFETARFIHAALRVELTNYVTRGERENKPLESICATASERDILANQAHIGWKVMPEDALRLSIEMVHGQVTESVMKAAHMAAILIARGFQVSAKFTMSNRKPPGSTGERLVFYVPTAALVPTLAAAMESGLFSGGIDGRGELDMVRYAYTGVLLPGFTTLRTSGEGGASSTAEGLEAVDALEQLKIDHSVLSLNRHDKDCGETVDLGDGDKVVLFDNELDD